MHTHFSAERASQEQTDLQRHGYRIRRDLWRGAALERALEKTRDIPRIATLA